LKADRELKAGEYRKLGIAEYWLFNPYGEFRDPRVQGWDLQAAGAPAPLPVEADGSVASRAMPVRFAVHETRLDVLDPRTGEPLTPLRAQELHILDEIAKRQREAELRRQAEQGAHREASARRRAEEELERLRAELEQLRQEREDDI
jgi:hypothetical protein